jgi:hypothetical protein
MTHRFVAIAAAVGLLGAGLDGQSPALGVEAQLRFLATARVVSSRAIGKGITGALRLTLTDGQFTHDAAFQRVNEQSSSEDIRRGRLRAGELQFVDSYRYNIAAWELARLLDLGHMMPPTVKRGYRGDLGSFAWWVDDVLMDEGERETTRTSPPNSVDFVRQRQRMFVFAELVRDMDRNKGNVVYTKDWRVVMLDFTRAFRQQPAIRQPEALGSCDRALLAKMRTLQRREIERVARDALTSFELDAVMKRRDLIVEHFDKLVAERGEKAVLY